MKKNYFMLAAATMMFAACAEIDLVNEIAVEETPQAISFETFANKATRAEFTSDNLSTQGFHVWGYKFPDANIVWDDAATTEVDETNYHTVFGGVEVVNGTYSPKQYWDKTMNYQFYAVAPASGSYNCDKGIITINNVVSAKSTESNDYLIDRNGATQAGTNTIAVPLVFNHTMAKVSFKIKNNVAAPITVTSLTMHGWDKGTGTFVQSINYPNLGVGEKEWTIASSSTTQANDGVVIDNTNNSAVTNLAASSTTNDVVGNSYIVVPQTVNTLTFTISYTINRTVDETTISESFEGITGELTSQTWGTDSHTTYTIIVGPAEIGFSASVLDWTYKPNDDADIQ